MTPQAYRSGADITAVLLVHARIDANGGIPARNPICAPRQGCDRVRGVGIMGYK